MHGILTCITACMACSTRALAGRGSEVERHTTGIYVFTSRGPLQLVVMHAAVQWFGTRHSARSARALRAQLLVRVTSAWLPEAMFRCTRRTVEVALSP